MADALLDGDCRGKSGDPVHIRTLQDGHVLADIRGQALQVPALAFCEQDVKGQRGLPRPGYAGHDDQLIAGNGDRDVLQVMLPGAADDNGAAPCGRRF